MRRERSVWSRAHLELAHREIARPRSQVRGGIPFSVPLLAVALRTVLEIDRVSRCALRLAADVLGRQTHRAGGHHHTRRDYHRETAARYQAGGHFCAASSFARGFWPV